MVIHKRAGQIAHKTDLINVENLIFQYYTLKPHVENHDHFVKFNTSGHRGSSYRYSFNEQHIIAITYAIIKIRKLNNIRGPCFIGKDTHALSGPAFITVVEVLIAYQVNIIVQPDFGYTPTPSISYAILEYNRYHKNKADGIILTASHNPPEDGGIKYNFSNGGSSNKNLTTNIEYIANQLIRNKLSHIKRINYNIAIKNSFYHEQDLLTPYVLSLNNVINMTTIKEAGLKIGVHPLGGAGINYWQFIAEYYNLNLKLINNTIDPTFSFMSLDYDGIIRMDCSSYWAMKNILNLSDKFDLILVNDPDHDRHGIITSEGLIDSNHYLAVAINYLICYRTQWKKNISIGKTIVSSTMIDHVVKNLGRTLIEMPVGFKWFVDGLYYGKYGFAGEESAGASFLQFNGIPWTTDKDGIILCLLAAEIISKTGKTLQQHYQEFVYRWGNFYYNRIYKKINIKHEKKIINISDIKINTDTLAGDPIISFSTKALGNNVSIGGFKVITEYGWFAFRLSGTEKIYKIYCESFKSKSHLKLIEKEANEIINQIIL